MTKFLVHTWAKNVDMEALTVSSHVFEFLKVRLKYAAIKYIKCNFLLKWTQKPLTKLLESIK